MLFCGETLGTGQGPAVDIAVDPLDGTTLISQVTCCWRQRPAECRAGLPSMGLHVASLLAARTDVCACTRACQQVPQTCTQQVAACRGAVELCA